ETKGREQSEDGDNSVRCCCADHLYHLLAIRIDTDHDVSRMPIFHQRPCCPHLRIHHILLQTYQHPGTHTVVYPGSIQTRRLTAYYTPYCQPQCLFHTSRIAPNRVINRMLRVVNKQQGETQGDQFCP